MVGKMSQFSQVPRKKKEKKKKRERNQIRSEKTGNKEKQPKVVCPVVVVADQIA